MLSSKLCRLFPCAMGAIAVVLFSLPDVSQAKTVTYGKKDQIRLIANMGGSANGNTTNLSASASADLKVQIAKKRRFGIAGIRGDASASLSGASVTVAGYFLNKNRTFVDESYSTDYDDSIDYYTGSKKFSRVRFAIGPIPVYAQPSFGAKVSDQISLRLASFPAGGGSVTATYSPLIVSATAKLDVGIGVKKASAGVRGRITLLTGKSTFEGTANIDDEGAGEANLEVFAELQGPRGKLTLFAKLFRVKKEKELWRFNSNSKAKFVLAASDYRFGNDGFVGRWNAYWDREEGVDQEGFFDLNDDGTIYLEVQPVGMPERRYSDDGNWIFTEFSWELDLRNPYFRHVGMGLSPDDDVMVFEGFAGSNEYILTLTRAQ